jgi:hypothetical protein
MRDGNHLPLIRELDRRTGDGLDVRLLWNEYDGRVSVFVHDARSGDGFRVPVLPHDQVLEVFDHPFAYAAARHPHERRRARASSGRPAGGVAGAGLATPPPV